MMILQISGANSPLSKKVAQDDPVHNEGFKVANEEKQEHGAKGQKSCQILTHGKTGQWQM